MQSLTMRFLYNGMAFSTGGLSVEAITAKFRNTVLYIIVRKAIWHDVRKILAIVYNFVVLDSLTWKGNLAMGFYRASRTNTYNTHDGQRGKLARGIKESHKTLRTLL